MSANTELRPLTKKEIDAVHNKSRDRAIASRYCKAILRYTSLSNHEIKRIEFVLEKMNAELIDEGTYTIENPSKNYAETEIDFQIYRIDVTGYEHVDLLCMLKSIGMELYTEIQNGTRKMKGRGKGRIGVNGSGREGKKYSHGKEIRKIVRMERKALTVILYNALKNLTTFAGEELDIMLSKGEIINVDNVPCINPSFIGPMNDDFADRFLALLRMLDIDPKTARGKIRDTDNRLIIAHSPHMRKVKQNIANMNAVISSLGDDYTDEQEQQIKAMIKAMNEENSELMIQVGLKRKQNKDGSFEPAIQFPLQRVFSGVNDNVSYPPIG